MNPKRVVSQRGRSLKPTELSDAVRRCAKLGGRETRTKLYPKSHLTRDKLDPRGSGEFSRACEKLAGF